MGWIFVDKDSEGGNVRSQMRSQMRSGGSSYRYMGGSGNYRDGYRDGYKHGWEDSEDDMSDESYRRARDSRGRYM